MVRTLLSILVRVGIGFPDALGLSGFTNAMAQRFK
jgi:hypothetical protein